MPTLRDIADRANVSPSTVSRVLNGKKIVNHQTRELVLAAIAELDYQPNAFAQSLARGRSMSVGVVTQKMGSPFYDAISQGVLEGFEHSGYGPLFVDGQWQRDTAVAAVKNLMGRQVEGLILLGDDLGETEMERLERRSLPVVVVGRQTPSTPCVFIDNHAAAAGAVNHLIDRGHRRIAIVMGLESHQDSIRRRQGYEDALRRRGIPVDPKLMMPGDYSSQSGVLAVQSLLARGVHFSAIFCANDQVAIGVRLALHRQGLRVPEDVSIVGFDDQGESAFLTPPLTTVRQPAVEMGRAAAAGMIDLINGRDWTPPRLDAELMIRETVANRSG